MDNNNISFTTTADDYTAYVCAASKDIQWTCLLLAVISGVLAIITAALLEILLTRFPFYSDVPPDLNSVLRFLYIFTLYLLINAFLRRYVAVENVHQDGYFLRSREISIDHNGIRETSKSHESFTRWDGVISIDETDQFIFIYVDQLAAHVIPKRAFKTPEDAKDFAKRVKSFWNAATANPPDMSQSEVKSQVSETANSPWALPHITIKSEAEIQ